MKFAYLGQCYNGLEHHANNKTPLPTVEEILWQALRKACLIFPTPVAGLESEEVSWEGCEYSKCGRTDKGVSAFGQVVALRLRSNRPLRKDARNHTQAAATELTMGDRTTPDDPKAVITAIDCTDDESSTSPADVDVPAESAHFDHIRHEINYPQILNKLLPPDIRVLAWCGDLPEDFSARFSCKGRGYKYFFTQPAFSPTVGSEDDNGTDVEKTSKSRRGGWLDIEAMRTAARRFEGLHDFRNFCKIDPSKQIENFQRRIFRSSIEELEPHQGPMSYLRKPHFTEYSGQFTKLDTGILAPGYKVYTFTLFGSAFLWHQVRHMVAILFLIGQGLESPSLIDELLDVEKNPQKPQYEMADDAPLVLWDCVFPQGHSDSLEPHDALPWVYVGDEVSSTLQASNGRGHDRYGPLGLVDQMWKVWRQRKIDELLAGTLMDTILSRGSSPRSYIDEQVHRKNSGASQKVFNGGDSARLMGKYIPVLKKPKMESVEVINARYAQRTQLKGDGKHHKVGL